MITTTVEPGAKNREAWLVEAVPPLAGILEQATDMRIPSLQVACGWPRQDRGGKVIGQCWPAKSGKGVAQLFISPTLKEPVRVLATLLHELIHAADDCENAHKGPFTRAARAVGLAGKPTATYAEEGTDLFKALTEIAHDLGDYPHLGLVPVNKMVKKQTTRMIKCECDACGYTLRTTTKWLDIAVPTCPLPSCPDFQEELRVERKDGEEGD